MRNPEQTKATILKESANLFNTKGYKATSLSDITTATGFTKGAIYKHFNNKEDLEQQALRSLGRTMFDILGKEIKVAKDYEAKMEVVFSFFENYLLNPPYQGGCPLLNSAVESDDANPGLRQQSFGMLVNLKSSLRRVLENAKKRKQIKPDTDVEQMVHVFIATLEGGIMMSKLERNNDAIAMCIDFLKKINKEIII
ncbi:TetR family transcriptional regulator [Nonlabens dokdonensis]|jgi:AcrR family transcriptional regulator|uniref:Transcriptional regulator, TetR family n=2 Tax=Nonlabens dokdonensis TaxID=328515 RepID=L7WC24_NONDD|nr:TetR/AcrR family transcriptional regulator [Nonlabens dokdonensis]AGC76433.1 transcriptional regulator, TetR family [Nonlabens dokdonensis DSW-6]PZX44090.1 TetR family transcriptional regulator [Nonlabens dokdonensis]